MILFFVLTFFLQNQPDNYFTRNNRYRSTIQPNAPVTPVFRSRYKKSPLAKSTSQTSVNSTNPFEDDYLDTVSQIESPIRSSGRKKRRAPQPPVSASSQTVSI